MCTELSHPGQRAFQGEAQTQREVQTPAVEGAGALRVSRTEVQGELRPESRREELEAQREKGEKELPPPPEKVIGEKGTESELLL